MVGRDDLAAQVAAIYACASEDEKPRTVILAGNYGESDAFDLCGTSTVIRAGNSLWERGKAVSSR